MQYKIELIPKSLQKIRQYQGLSRADFAAKVGISAILVYMLEAERVNITENTEKKIRESLGIDDESLTRFEALTDAIEEIVGN
ncbi:XRE family transcriptional regulator [Salibacterium salarium]|uniref:XRE family transcriptional regulator n=1 Tax=Salibacterium salarium TaxID=284579 RepID=A0A3R9QX62_9BACI|nr:helix-turn-helix transcriptional regulator [Salibacterium salarium]RSL35309.1 XRE family transcriptional regulator [Salibacterium salarium]